MIRHVKEAKILRTQIKTEIEAVSESLLKQTEDHASLLQDTCYADLAQCTSQSGIPSELQESAELELDSLHRTAANLSAANIRVLALADELSARLRDVNTSVNRKWYRINPPANSTIDYQEQNNDFFARGMNGYKLALVMILGSFAGVIVEMLWCFIRNGYFESRAGVVWGPFNPLYGIGAVALSALLYRYRNRGKWLSFLGGMIVGSVVEYVCSYGQELLFGSRSWDYSAIPLNLNGRICLLYSVFWGFLGVLWIKDLYPRMAKWLLKIPNKCGKIATWVLVVFMVVNCAVSLIAMDRWAERQNGIAPASAIDTLIDERFPNERMERIYANMDFGGNE